jgi:hypothetical protein
MKKRELKRLKRIHNRHEYDHVKRIEKEKIHITYDPAGCHGV